ncbi:MAG: hypothetical protein WD114_07160 [Phycisphaerales bacterium]
MKHSTPASLIVLLAAASGLAAAQPEKTDNSDNDLLRGPSVVDTAEPTEERDAGDAMEAQGDERPAWARKPIVFREYIIILRQMSNARQGNPLAVSDEQQEKIDEILRDHRVAMRDFQQEHKDQLQRLRRAANSNRDRNNQPGQFGAPTTIRDMEQQENEEGGDLGGVEDGQVDSSRAEKAREKLRAFIDNAPPSRESLEKLGAVLDDKQQELIKERIMQHRKRLHERAQEAGDDAEDGDDGAEDAVRPVRRQRMNRDRAQPQERDSEKPTKRGGRDD